MVYDPYVACILVIPLRETTSSYSIKRNNIKNTNPRNQKYDIKMNTKASKNINTEQLFAPMTMMQKKRKTQKIKT